MKTKYRKNPKKQAVCILLLAFVLCGGTVAFCSSPQSVIIQESILTNEERAVMTSKEITDRERIYDRQVLDRQPYDFSEVTIACIGDSITEGVNGSTGHADGLTYPEVIKEALHAKEVYNLGIGGSTIGDYWAAAMVNRYMEIPQDTDIIIVYGGINDVFSGTGETIGNLTALTDDTFCGDLDTLLEGIRINYPTSWLILVTPMDTVTIEEVRALNPQMKPIEEYVDAMITLAQKYDVDVIDLFHSNFMNSYDPEVFSTYVPGCHPTDEGYRILGEHIAKEVIRISLENEADGQFLGKWNGFTVSGNVYGGVSDNAPGDAGSNSVSGNTSDDVSSNSASGNAFYGVSGNSVSGNASDDVSGNSVSGNTAYDVSGNSVSGNAAGDVGGDGVSGNTSYDAGGNGISGNTSYDVSGNGIWGNPPDEEADGSRSDSHYGEILESGMDILMNGRQTDSNP